MNSAAQLNLLPNANVVDKSKRLGEHFLCLNSIGPEIGCGKNEACKSCTIRNSIKDAFENNKTTRATTELIIGTNLYPQKIHIIVSVSPFLYNEKTYALITIENISELMLLRSLLPICAHCKKIRNDKQYWQTVEGVFYLASRCKFHSFDLS